MKKLTTLTLIGAASALALSATAASAQMYDGRHMDRAYGGRSYDERSAGRGYDERSAGRGYDERFAGRGYLGNIRERLAQIGRRIDLGMRRGELTGQEASSARDQYRQIAHRADYYRSGGGYSRTELADLDHRLDNLERQVRADSHDRQYGYGYGYRR